MTLPQPMAYRKDIQILRGIAILFVLAYHLQAPGAGSGFLGVDTFFVISGFLMACLYVPGGMTMFFARRAKRILPAYFATILVTLVVAVFVTVPPDLADVTNQALYAALLAPNVGFWMANSYFAKDTFTPLLHLWSLGVEIQFYVLVPLIAWIVRRLRLLLPLAIIGSLAACFLAIGISPKTAFFLLPFRMWEFLLGYGVAVGLTRGGMPIRHQATLAWLSVAVLIAAPFLAIDGDSLNPITGHPGLAALATALAAAALLAVGLPAALVCARPARWLATLGKYSYSIYLVHFPVITMALYAPYAGTRLGIPDPFTLVFMLIATGALSVLGHRFVETPLRHARFSWIAAMVAAQAALVAFVLVAGPLVAAFHDERENRVFAGSADRAPYRCGKVVRLIDPAALTCALREGSAAAPRILLVGNSHADAIKTAVLDAARTIDATLRFVVPNEPLMSAAYGPAAIVDDAVDHRIDHIVVHYSRGNPPLAALQQLVDRARAHDIRVSFIAPVPAWSGKVPELLYAHIRHGTPLPRQDIADYVAMNEEYLAPLRAIDAPNFTYFETAPYLCRNACRMIDESGRPLYFDNHHLTLTGAAELAPLFRRVLGSSVR